MCFEIVNNLKNIMVYVHRVRPIDNNARIVWYLVERGLDTGFVQERDFFRKSKRDRFLVLILLLFVVIRMFVIFSQDIKDRHGHTNSNTFQQLCEEDHYNGSHKRDELLMPEAEHASVQTEFRQLVTHHQQDRRQACERYQVEEPRYEVSRQQKDCPVTDG